MKKLCLAVMAALSLSACAPMLSGLATMAGAPPAPVVVADKTKLDEKAGLAVETMYTALTTAGALAYRTKLVAPSVDAAVQRDDFCALVYAKLYEPTDRGGTLASLECQLRRARDLTRQAYDAANADAYDKAAREAVAIGRTMLALTKGN